jgi:hypothetical protein
MLRKSALSILFAVLLGASTMAAADNAVIIISHEVADFFAWKKAFDAGKEARRKAGLTERYVMQEADRPNFLIVVLEAASTETAKKYVSDQGFRDRIKKASVSGTAEIKIGTSDPIGK